MINPYESSMTKEEMRRTWEEWLPKRKLMFFLARRFPKLLSHFYRQTFLSGKHGQIDKWMSLSLKKKVIYFIFLNDQNASKHFHLYLSHISLLVVAWLVLVIAVVGEVFMF